MLPEAHVEAPTEGSVILAAILLKVVFMVCSVSYLCYFFFSNITFYICASFTFYCVLFFCNTKTIRHETIIAYSSIAHMNFAVLGLFSNNLYSLLVSF